MNRLIRTLTFYLLAVAGVAGLGLFTSCNIIGSGTSGARGGLNVLVTDGPTDDWQQVIVVLKSISLHSADSNSWKDVWTADPANAAAGTVNLVELNDVALILQTAEIPVGTYNRLKLVINTDPTTMKLVTDDGTEILPANITVVDPSGRGEIKVDLNPSITVEEGKTANVMVDFDLAHPLSIVNLDGKVVISLKIRHRPLPRFLRMIQFARTIGDITEAAANTDGTGTFTIKTLQEADIQFNVNANTIYFDVDDPGSAANLDELKALAGTGAALVASNMNADGSLYARRVWYSADIEKLPQFTPEGLVRRVGDNWLSIIKKRTEELPTSHHHRCDWNSETVFVDENTTWTFRDEIAMGTGTSILRSIARGFRVEVEYVDIDIYPRVAKSINVQSAHTEGLVVNATAENFTLGWFRNTKTLVYSGLADHTFGWWFYGLDSGRSTVVEDFIEAVAQARSAHLWVFACAQLYWDQANSRWVVENLILAPLRLHDFTKITTGYKADPGSMVVSTYDCWDWSTPVDMTIWLDDEGDLQTVVGSFVWNAETNLVTFTLPVLPSEWEALLTPAINKVKIWVRPVKGPDTTWSWHAYCVIAYQLIL